MPSEFDLFFVFCLKWKIAAQKVRERTAEARVTFVRALRIRSVGNDDGERANAQ